MFIGAVAECVDAVGVDAVAECTVVVEVDVVAKWADAVDATERGHGG